MAITLVQTGTGASTTYPLGAAMGADVTANNVLIAAFADQAQTCTTQTISDTRSSSWTQIIAKTNGGAALMWWATVPTSGPDTITVAAGGCGAGDTKAMTVYEISGGDTTTIASDFGTGTGTSLSTTAVSFNNGALLVGAGAGNGASGPAATAGTGFTLQRNNQSAYSEDATSGVSSPTTFPATLSVSNVWVDVGMIINPLGGFSESGAKRQYRRLGFLIRAWDSLKCGENVISVRNLRM